MTSKKQRALLKSVTCDHMVPLSNFEYAATLRQYGERTTLVEWTMRDLYDSLARELRDCGAVQEDAKYANGRAIMTLTVEIKFPKEGK